MVFSEGSSMLGEDHKFKSASESCAEKEFTSLNFGMFEVLFKVYPIRQSLLTSLSAIDVASLLEVVGGEHDIGPHERAKYLNPMRDLFTDKELLKLQQDMAEIDDHHIVIWGTDLEEFLRRTPDTLARPDGKKLDLWMAQVSTKRADWLDFEFNQELWPPYGKIDFARRAEQRPRIEIPGKWSPLPGRQCQTPPFRNPKVKKRRQERTDDVRLYLHQPRESANNPDDLLWIIENWQIFPRRVPVGPYRPEEPREYAWQAMSGDEKLHYMTTRDMQTFHVKTVQHIAPGMQFYSPPTPPNFYRRNLSCPGGGKLLVSWELTWYRGKSKKSRQCDECEFVFSLQDGSDDERSIETFGLHTTAP
jgi:hypothetical protein